MHGNLVYIGETTLGQNHLDPLVPRRHRQIEHDGQPRRARGPGRQPRRRHRHRHPVARHPRHFQLAESRVEYALNDYLYGKCSIEEAAYDVTDAAIGTVD